MTVPCLLSGDVWEEVKEASNPEVTKPGKPEKASKKPKSAKKK